MILVVVVAIVTIVVTIVTIVVAVVTIVVIAVGTIIEMINCWSHCLELHRGDIRRLIWEQVQINYLVWFQNMDREMRLGVFAGLLLLIFKGYIF